MILLLEGRPWIPTIAVLSVLVVVLAILVWLKRSRRPAPAVRAPAPRAPEPHVELGAPRTMQIDVSDDPVNRTLAAEPEVRTALNVAPKVAARRAPPRVTLPPDSEDPGPTEHINRQPPAPRPIERPRPALALPLSNEGRDIVDGLGVGPAPLDAWSRQLRDSLPPRSGTDTPTTEMEALLRALRDMPEDIRARWHEGERADSELVRRYVEERHLLARSTRAPYGERPDRVSENVVTALRARHDVERLYDKAMETTVAARRDEIRRAIIEAQARFLCPVQAREPRFDKFFYHVSKAALEQDDTSSATDPLPVPGGCMPRVLKTVLERCERGREAREEGFRLDPNQWTEVTARGGDHLGQLEAVRPVVAAFAGPATAPKSTTERPRASVRVTTSPAPAAAPSDRRPPSSYSEPGVTAEVRYLFSAEVLFEPGSGKPRSEAIWEQLVARLAAATLRRLASAPPPERLRYEDEERKARLAPILGAAPVELVLSACGEELEVIHATQSLGLRTVKRALMHARQRAEDRELLARAVRGAQKPDA